MTEQSRAQQLVGDISPKLATLTDQVLFADVWERPELPKRDRSLITVASLVTSGSTEQLFGHLRLAKTNGLTEAELSEAITHLAFLRGLAEGDVRHGGRQAGVCRVAAFASGNSALRGLPLERGDLCTRGPDELIVGVGVAVEAPTAVGRFRQQDPGAFG